jgi:hypothetical protein
MGRFPTWILALFFLFVIGVWLLHFWRQHRRTEAWRRVADDLGIDFLGDASDLIARCGQMKVFDVGRSRRLLNALCGDAGDVRVTLGDFRYRVGTGKHAHTRERTVCVLESDRLCLPHCYLRPEVPIVDSLGSLLGGQDIDFPDDRDFSRAYVLQGTSEAAIRELFDADVRAWFAARGGDNLYFEARGGTLVFHTGNRRRPDRAREIIQQGLEILELLAKTPSSVC